MPFFFKAEEKIHEMIGEYLQTVDKCLKVWHESIAECLERGHDVAHPGYQRTHQMESKADDLRREIAMILYGKALLPESRGDLLNLLEAIDMIPNSAETVLSAMETQRIDIPEQFQASFRDLVEANMEAVEYLLKTADAVFTNPKQTLYLVKEVDIRESASDRLENRLVGEIFDSGIDKADKILLRSIVFLIGAIADRAENAADRMGLTAIKRRV